MSSYKGNFEYGVDFISVSDPRFRKWKRSQRMSKRKKRNLKIQNAYGNLLYSSKNSFYKKRKRFFIF